MDDKKKLLYLAVRARENLVFIGKVSSFTSYNDKGKFDVLPGHANFISLINKSLLFKDLAGESHEIKIGLGIMRVVKNNVEVYLGVEGLKGI